VQRGDVGDCLQKLTRPGGRVPVDMSQTLDTLSTLRRHHGTAAAFQWLIARGLQKTIQFEVNELSWLEKKQRSTSVVRASTMNFECRFLSAVEIAAFATDPTNELAVEFASRASAGLDCCFAIVDRGRLAAYSWYALQSIEGAHHVGLPMSFPSNTAYMYKAFTHPEYRGKGLYGIGVSRALEALAPRGVTRLVTSINRANFASMGSTRRLGFKSLGNLWTLGPGARRIAWTPRAAQRLGIQFGGNAVVAQRS